MGGLLTSLANSEETGGEFGLLEAVLKPGNEPPPHVHTREDELFYVLEGSVDFYVEDKVFLVERGGSLFLPRFRPHAFIIRSPRVRLLTLFTPGGLEQAFFSKSIPAKHLDLPTEAITYSTADLQEVVQRLGEYGARILPPDEVGKEMPSYARASASRDTRSN